MRIRIYQINPERHSMFRSYDENRAINPDEYDSVFDADVDCENLEQIFSQFNTIYHPLFRGRSLSVSDVVELTDIGTFHYCDSVGFREIEFDPYQTYMQGFQGGTKPPECTARPCRGLLISKGLRRMSLHDKTKSNTARSFAL